MTILGRTWTVADTRRVLWTAGQAALGVIAASTITDVKTAKVAALAALTVGLATAASAVKNWWLADSSPVK